LSRLSLTITVDQNREKSLDSGHHLHHPQSHDVCPRILPTMSNSSFIASSSSESE
jgi:hypothetical protein